MVSVLKKEGTKKKTHHATPREVKRHKVLALLEYGIKPAEICANTEYGRDLVRTVDKLRREGKSLVPNYHGSGRTTRTNEFLKKIGHIFETKPDQNFTVTALELGVSEKTVRRSAKELGFKSYQHRRRALLTKKIMEKRLDRCAELLVWLANPLNKSIVIIFSDKKLWDIDPHINRRNKRYIAKNRDRVPAMWSTKHPQSAMMLGQCLIILI